MNRSVPVLRKPTRCQAIPLQGDGGELFAILVIEESGKQTHVPVEEFVGSFRPTQATSSRELFATLTPAQVMEDSAAAPAAETPPSEPPTTG